MDDLGSQLKALRKRHGLTQKELSLKIRRSAAAISSYESNRQQPPLDVVASICQVFGISIDYFLGISRDDWLSLNNRTDAQKQFMYLLNQEFADSSNKGTELSDQQVKIIKQ